MKKRVKADIQMVRERLNVIIIHSKYFPNSDCRRDVQTT